MKKNLQIDNPVHPTKSGERERAMKALEKAKQIPRKVVFLPKGYTKDFKPKNI